MSIINTSIIISTYNSPMWLEKVLYGYNIQTYRKFEVLIADDGSSDETKNLISKIKNDVFYPIQHIWHEDIGFRKCEIFNKAILKTASSYIIMSDGDCIPKKNFVEQHIKFRQKKYFLSGGYFMLPLSISKAVTKDDIYEERCFDIKWLIANGLKKSFKNNKITAGLLKAYILNKCTPTKATWNGHNVSGWKEDIVSVNGFDERMQYGGEDRELGERLFNMGVKAKQIRYSAICIHLDHERGYVNQEALDRNLEIRKATKRHQIVKTKYGIVKNL